MSALPETATRRSGGVLIAVLSLAAMVVSIMQTQAVPILGLIAGDLDASVPARE